MSPLRIIFAGTPDFSVPCLQALRDAGHEVVAVYTQPDRPAGRGRKLTPGPIKEAATALGLPLFQPPTLRDPAAIATLRELGADLMVVVAYGLLLPPAVLETPRLGCVNVHASVLPRWRGAAPIQRAILAGDTQSGVAIMRMEAGLDTGPVYAVRTVAIGPRMTAGELHDVLAEEGATALLAVLEDIGTGTARPTPQLAAGVTYAARIDKSEAHIDWGMSAAGIDRQVRAFNPWPIAQTRFQGEQLRVLRAHPATATERVRAVPGTVLGVDSAGLAVACGEGVLTLEIVQRPGRRPVSAFDFALAASLEGVVLG